ncbi:MAG: murein biosynthesis integral membrane protein MurJ [Solirubrobacteraceae bacterium MAG38_C4-C5]|nr:murein biosynthesis integral membrane protein MurJ [Candidatus Siliceabacter maunaloa]
MATDSPSAGRRIVRNTAIFSIATGLSRVAGLGREIVASAYFGTSGAFSAFTIAFQVPNLVRSLFADAALGAAFVPVFTELLETKNHKDAYRLASTLFFVILGVLGIIAAAFMVAAPWVMPLFTGDAFDRELVDLTVGLSQVLFPIVVLLGVNGLLVGILNAHDHFSVPALSPLLWNAIIIAFLVGAHATLDGQDQLYGYAVGVLVGTAAQVAVAVPVLRRVGFELRVVVALRDPRLRRVLKLMLPVTIGLGLINFNLLVNSVLGSFVSREAPRAIEAAFRVYMLPQGMFSVAVATVLFPALSRLAARRDLDGLRALTSTGLRAIFLLLIPCAALTLVLSEPIVRLVYERGDFDAQSTRAVSEALFWFSFSLPFAGANLLLTRTFFSLQRPWAPTALAGLNLAVNVAVALALYRSLGIAGIVIATAVATAVMTLAQALVLRRSLHGRLEAGTTLAAIARMLVAAAALGGVAWVTWMGLDELLGRSLPAQLVAVGTGIAAGGLVYAGAVLLLRVPEAARIERMVEARLSRRRQL